MQLSRITSFHASARPRDVAIVDVGEGRNFTWSELDSRVAHWASAISQLGLGLGDRMGVLSRNTHRMLECYLAAARLGVIMVPLNTRLVPAELQFLIEDSQMKMLVVDAPFVSKVRDSGAEGEVQVLVGMGGDHGLSLDYERLISSAPGPHRGNDFDGSHPLTLGYTSGTTGLPKGALISHRGHTLAALLSSAAWGNSPHHRNMVCLPLFLAGGWNGVACYSLLLGATSYVMDFDPAKVLEVVSSQRLHHLPLVPTMVNMVLQVPGIDDLDFSDIKTVLYAGSSMPPEILPRAIEVFGERFVSPYGMTESCCIGTVLSPRDIILDSQGRPGPHASSVGRAMPMTSIRVVNDDDVDVDADGATPGEILIKGETLLSEYWNRPDATQDAFIDGWFRTGDVGVVDGDGYVTIVDRKKDLIISGGSNVASVEVENVLYRDPNVQLAAVVGAPDERWGEAVTAYVVPKAGTRVSEQDLRALSAQFLSDYKRPKRYIVVDSLPMTALGKISKKDLRSQLKAETESF